MSRLFNDAASDFGENASAVLTSLPICISCFFKSDTITLTQTLVCIGRSDGTQGHWALQARGATAGDPISAIARNSGGTAAAANSATGYSANTWTHAGASFESSTSRYGIIEGVKGTVNTSNISPTSNVTELGRLINAGAGSQYLSGDLAEVGIWNVTLDDADWLMLAAHYSPMMVKPESLVAYWRLTGRSSPEPDEFGSFDATLTGTAQSDHPTIWYPDGNRLILPEAAGGGATAFPWHYYQQMMAG